MGSTLNDRRQSSLLPIPDSRPRMARADLRKPETDAWRQQIGQAIARAMSLCGWSLKEFAGAVGRDPRQCARWIDGTERPQLDVVFAVERLRQPLVQALSELAGADVQTVITIRRIA